MKAKIKVQGMHCKSCVMLISDALDDIGVKATVDVKSGEVVVEFDDSKTSLDSIKKAIRAEGYKV